MNDLEIYISEELIRMMDRELLLREQIEELIREAEATNHKLYDEDENIFIAHKRFGTITIWVRYRQAQQAQQGTVLCCETETQQRTVPCCAPCCEIVNVYYHRMDIREDQ